MWPFVPNLSVACLVLAVSLQIGTPSVCQANISECDAAGNDVVELLQHFSVIDKGIERHTAIANGKEAKTNAKRGDKNAADLIIVGIGDSGTRGVKDTFEHLGMRFSPLQEEASGDNLASAANDEFIAPLLSISGGRISSEGYKTDPDLWRATKERIKESIFFTFAGIVANSTDLTMRSDNVSWGLKNPGQYYLLPGYDEAFNNKTKYLFVSRDPRDLCTDEPDGLHNATKKMMGWFGKYEAGTKHGTDCYGMWASVMEDMFALYENEPRFRILRIEDLVLPDPTLENSSAHILNSLADFAGLPRPSREDAMSWLSHMHSFNSSYEGYHYNMTDRNRTMVSAKFFEHVLEDPVEFLLLGKLGYIAEDYGLAVPGSPSVFTPADEIGELSSQGPSLVITGIGDSGTLGVARVYNEMGLYFCRVCKHDMEDNIPSLEIGNNDLIPLLISTRGKISSTEYRDSSGLWKSTLKKLKLTIAATKQQMLAENESLSFDGLSWAVKVPNHFFILPAYDEAFNNSTKYLIVAMDPRVTCTSHNLQSFEQYGMFVEGTENGTNCWSFYSSLYFQLFQLYEHEPRFKIIRVEDLVVPGLATSDLQTSVLHCISDLAGLPRSSADYALKILNKSWEYTSSYIGMTGANRAKLEEEFSRHLQTDIQMQNVMKKLGYKLNAYGLHRPDSLSVCNPHL